MNYFGTDGIRGKVGGQYINKTWFERLGYALACVLAQNTGAKVVVGLDSRESGGQLQQALEVGLLKGGIKDIGLLGLMPTPGVAHAAAVFKATGIAITASHNPYTDNGIKFFDETGFKWTHTQAALIEKVLDRMETVPDASTTGRVHYIEDSDKSYQNACRAVLDQTKPLKPFKVVLDCANGAMSFVAPEILKSLGLELIVLFNEPNGRNINQGCGSTHPEALQQAVRANNADLGVAFDGDGDRIIMVDQKGQVVDGDDLLYVLIKHNCAAGRWQDGGVVGTVMTSLGLEHACFEYAIPFERVAVGDQHIIAALREKGWQWGGEPSGHVINLNASTTGDGLMVALQVLEALSCLELPLHECVKEMFHFPRALLSFPVSQPKEIINNKAVKAAVRSVNHDLVRNGRILLRPSGTESVLRLLVEASEKSMVEKAVKKISKAIEPHC